MKKIKILHIEDDKIDRMAFERFVKNMPDSYELVPATSIKEGQQVFDKQNFDIIVSDFSLGDGTAFDVLKMKKDTPVIVTTGKGSEEIAVEIMKAGAVDYLIKGPDWNYLKTIHSVIVNAVERNHLQKKLEKYAQQLKEYKHFFDNSHDLVCIANMDGHFEILNPNWEKILGYSENELLQNHFLNFTHPDDIDLAKQEFEKLKTGVNTINIVTRYRKKDGNYIWLDWNSTPDLAKGKFYAIARDINDRKEAEEARRKYAILEANKSKEMEQFTYIASHDLREPLLTIKNYIAIMMEDYGESLNEEAKKYTQSILKAANRMDDLIMGLLDYSRLSKPKQLQEVDCNEILNEVKADLNSLISANSANITNSELPILMAYPLELKLLFQNLINNAIKFKRKETAPEIHISSQKIENGWQFKLKDNGIGIDEKYKEKIFIMFQRLHDKNEYSGTGIGLAHCKKIAELHNGNIWVESVVGKGSTFCFTIQT